ncbi:MAG: hypothetical protein KAJ57_06630 [Woeseiaceae bacterium]|nr:hypothetical protein [Woeseiaceae bacterium]
MNEVGEKPAIGGDQIFSRSRMITCIVPDDGTDRELIRSLRDDKNIVTANSKPCRSVGMLRPSQTKPGRLPESELARMVEVVVPDGEAGDFFAWIHDVARIDKPGGGAIWMGKTISATKYELPAEELQ